MLQKSAWCKLEKAAKARLRRSEESTRTCQPEADQDQLVFEETAALLFAKDPATTLATGGIGR